MFRKFFARPVSIVILFSTLFMGCSKKDEPSEIKLDTPPTVLAATDVTGTTLVANWEKVTGAKYYKLEVSEDIGFTKLVSAYSDIQVSATNLAIEGLTASKKYFYRVKAGNSKGETDYSKVAAVRRINKSLLYDITWDGDEVKSNVTFVFMDMTFSSTGDYTGSIGSMVISSGTWQWKNDTDTMAVTSSSGSFEINFLDVDSNGYVAYMSALTSELAYFNK